MLGGAGDEAGSEIGDIQTQAVGLAGIQRRCSKFVYIFSKIH
jgi:hypothetical protein